MLFPEPFSINIFFQAKTTTTTCAVGQRAHYLGGVVLQHADGLGVDDRGLALQVCDGAVGLDGQDGVGLRHVHRVLDVGGAAVLQLHLLQAALLIFICSETRRRRTFTRRNWAQEEGENRGLSLRAGGWLPLMNVVRRTVSLDYEAVKKYNYGSFCYISLSFFLIPFEKQGTYFKNTVPQKCHKDCEHSKNQI